MSWGVAVVSASAAILRRSLAPKPWDCKALPLVGLARASSAEALGTLRLPLESVWIQDAQNDLAAGKTLGITSKQASKRELHAHASSVSCTDAASGPW